MKKSIRKLLTVLLSTLTLFSMSVAGCGEEQAKFDNFADKTVEVSLGERYMLELAPLLGSDGNYYTVTATVKDEAGKEVQPFGATLLIDALQDYTVTYSVMDGKKVIKTVTVKLDVKNKTAPNIVLEDIKNLYAVGEAFTLPKAEVYDLSGESLTPTTQILDAEGKELSFDTEKGVFQCEKVGSYTLRVTAKNGGGATGETLFPFTVSEFNAKLFKASAETLYNIDNGNAYKNKLLTEEDLADLNLNGYYYGDTAVQIEYINQKPYVLKGVNSYFSANEIPKRKYFTMHFALVMDESLSLPKENSAFCFHAGSTSGNLQNLLFGKENGFGGKVVFGQNTKYKFNTWYQLTLPAEKYAELLAGERGVNLFAVYEEKLDGMPKGFRDKMKIIIGDIEVYDSLIADSNGDNFVTEDYFS